MKTTMDKFIAMKVADLLERDGWTQFRLQDDETGARCLMGAFVAVSNSDANVAAYMSAGGDMTLHRLADHIGVQIYESAAWYALSAWNDVEGRSGEQVIKELRSFAATGAA